MIRAIFKFGQWLFVGTVALILMLLVISVGLLYTQSGLRLVVWGAEKALPELTVAGVQGVLGRQFTLNGVEFHQPQNSLDLSLDSATLAIKGRCLFQPALCIDSLVLSGVKFRMPQIPATNGDTQSPPASSVINAPLPIRIENIELNNIDLDVSGNRVTWQHFSTAVSWRHSKLKVSGTQWKDIGLTLATAQTEATPSGAPDNTPSQPVVLPEVLIPLSVELAGFELSNFTLHQATPVIVNHLNLALQAHQHDIELNSFVLDMPEADVQAQAKIALKDGYPLEAQLASTLKLAQARGQKLKASLSGSVDKLRLDLALSGRASGDITAELQPLLFRLPFKLSVSKLSGQWPLVAQEADYRADIASASISGSLDKFTLALEGEVAGRSVPQAALSLKGQGSRNDIQLEQVDVHTLGGDISGTINAGWADFVRADMHLRMNQIQPDKQWPDMAGVINGEVIASAESGHGNVWQVDASKLDIKGRIRGYPLDVNGAVHAFQHQQNDTISLTTPGLTVAHGTNRIDVRGSLDRQWNIDVAVNMPELAKSVDGLFGSIGGNVQLRGEAVKPEVHLDLQANQIEWQDLVKVGRSRINGVVSPLPDPAGEVSVAVEHLTLQDQYLDRVNLALSGDMANHKLSLETKADWGSSVINLQGQLNQQLTRWSGVITRAEVMSLPSRLYLEAPTHLVADIAQQQVTVDAHCWRESGARLCLKQRSSFSAQAAQVQLTLSRFSFAQITHLLPLSTQIVGQADADIFLSWRKEAPPEVNADVRFTQGYVIQNLSQQLTVKWDNASVRARLSHNKLSAAGQIHLTDNGDVDLNLAIADVTAAKKALAGHLVVHQVTLDALGPLLGEYSQVNSTINSDISLQGTLLHPKAFGQLTVSDIVAQGEITPVDINQGQLAVNFTGYQAALSAQLDTADGKLNLDGSADWQDMRQWKINSRVYADKLSVRLPPMVDIKASPDLQLTMVPGKTQVDGDINLPWGRIVVDELPASAVSVSSDQVIVDQNLEPITRESPIPMKIETNVRVIIGDDFHLEAFGLKGNLTGQLNVTQRDNAPFVSGEVNIVDGTYRSFGQDLVIQKGKVLMNGPVNKPYLSITAIRNPANIEDNVTAGIQVTGSADNPSVTIFSDPAMGQANALSYLLRGRDLDAESGDNSMTTTLIGLSLAQSGKLVGEIGQAFGVQDLQVDTAGAGDNSQVTVSGYVLPGLQVKYGVGIFNSIGEFTLRYRLMKNLYIQAVSGLTSAVDILYQFEFD